ncbi:bile acid:sodium symporter family protein [Cellulomonas soli]|uniref:Bile acid:sodium symporter n=1 Tax=Cellulomonas soli TaxID=931535 RepID=A0A512PGZ7_9CELL|nr:bile acid:sodium symporter family protein [Cellulomonas soli]NYI59673.1 sodium/bile acid cotransporter 7 [Cellulomonas soli]GEP70467.1 bile acid:sodium symporter [Cellulomonas soli]
MQGRWAGVRGVVGRWADPLVLMIVAVLVLGLLVPADGSFAAVLDHVRTAAIVLLFFLYGARMHATEVRAGLRNWKLQGSMLAATYVVFPLLGLAVQLLPDHVMAPDLRTGMLFLSVLPSTVQSSVVFTSIARGNVAGAITGATVSNVLGIVVTPLLVGVLMSRTGGSTGGSLAATLLQLLLPFAAGQAVQPWIGGWVRAHPHLLKISDRSTILLVAYTSVSEAQTSGAWSHITWVALLVLVVVCAALLAAMLSLTWRAGAGLRLPYPDRIALLMCGSKKSLATGLPMAAVLFSPVVAASVTLPVVVFHQLQLATCAVVARRLADRDGQSV